MTLRIGACVITGKASSEQEGPFFQQAFAQRSGKRITGTCRHTRETLSRENPRIAFPLPHPTLQLLFIGAWDVFVPLDPEWCHRIFPFVVDLPNLLSSWVRG